MLKIAKPKGMREKELLCSAYKQCPDNIVTKFVHDEKTRVGCMVLYKAVTTLYSSVHYVQMPRNLERDIKGNIVMPKPKVMLKHENPLISIE